MEVVVSFYLLFALARGELGETKWQAYDEGCYEKCPRNRWAFEEIRHFEASLTHPSACLTFDPALAPDLQEGHRRETLPHPPTWVGADRGMLPWATKKQTASWRTMMIAAREGPRDQDAWQRRTASCSQLHYSSPSLCQLCLQGPGSQLAPPFPSSSSPGSFLCLLCPLPPSGLMLCSIPAALNSIQSTSSRSHVSLYNSRCQKVSITYWRRRKTPVSRKTSECLYFYLIAKLLQFSFSLILDSGSCLNINW